MKRILIIFAILLVIVALWYFLIRKKDEKTDGATDTTDKSKSTSPKSLTDIARDTAEAKSKNAQIVTELQQSVKPTYAVKLDSKEVQNQIEKLAKLYSKTRNSDYITALEDAGIGKELVPNDPDWFVDNFLKKTYGNTNFSNIAVKPLDFFPSEKRTLENDIKTLKAFRITDWTNNKDEAKRFQNVVKGTVKDVTGVDLFFGKDADVSANVRKLKNRVTFTIDWIEKYIKYGTAASEVARNLALDSMVKNGWTIQGLNAKMD